MSEDDEARREELLAFINSLTPREKPFFIPARHFMEIEVNPRPGESYYAAEARASAEKLRELKAELDAITERQDRASSDDPKGGPT